MRIQQNKYLAKPSFARKSSLLLIAFLATVSTVLAQPDRVTVQEVKTLTDKKSDFLIVDVRGQRAYEKSHLPNAISLPLGELILRHGELPKEKKIVFYCS